MFLPTSQPTLAEYTLIYAVPLWWRYNLATQVNSLNNIKIKHILYYLYWDIISITNSACQPSISLNDIINPSAILSMPSSPMRLFRRFKDCKEEFLESQFQNGGFWVWAKHQRRKSWEIFGRECIHIIYQNHEIMPLNLSTPWTT